MSTNPNSSQRLFTRRDFLSTSLKAGAAALTTGLLPNLNAHAARRYNVLFIMVDDLRPLLGCYGHSEMHTPHIDALARRGTLFNRAYCQFPVCNPSRVSLLTGLRPETTGFVHNRQIFREALSDVVTLPQHFKAHGYHTRAIGKVTHGPSAYRYSWSIPDWAPRYRAPNGKPLWQALDVGDDELRDGQVAKHASEVLAEIREGPFFLAVGFYKPHLPYHVPRKYFDLYETQTFEARPDIRLPAAHEMHIYSDTPAAGEPFTEEQTLALMRGYAAATSYVDTQVGRVLHQLDALGLTDNTITVFCGDHGYHLGEHGAWGKHTLFESALRSPLIVSIPGHSQDTKTEAIVELVDIFPTLSDACELPLRPEIEGISMVPVIENPTRPWKTAAFSQYGQKSFSIRTERYRYTEWGNGQTELYNYETDSDGTENLVHLPENAALAAHLSERRRAGWQEALPVGYLLRQTSGTGNTLRLRQTLPWDINNDGVVDIRDLLIVSNNFGVKTGLWKAYPRRVSNLKELLITQESTGMEKLEHPKADVNQDGTVDVIDLLIVASHFGESSNPGAPPSTMSLQPEHAACVATWLSDAHAANDGSALFREGIAALEQLLATVTPPKTTLLPNYPNPFNPETWIPYDLAENAEVSIHIWTLKGESVRRLSAGFQTAGTYRSRAQAAHWDGRNAAGELVASGIYFYTLHAGNVKATRQMVILK